MKIRMMSLFNVVLTERAILIAGKETTLQLI